MKPELSSMTRKAFNPTVGIVGGGQLARMMVQAAGRLGVDAHVLARVTDESARGIWPAVHNGDPADPSVLEEFSRGCDVLTFDHENVDPELVDALVRVGRVARPGASALRFCDKAAQRTALATLGFVVPPFTLATTVAEAEAFARLHGGWPLVAKTPRGGYDGKGVRWVDGAEQVLVAFALAGGSPLLLEPALAIERELAVLVARRPDGGHVVYPIVETFQRDGICCAMVAPAEIEPALACEASSIAVAIADLVDMVGVLAVEFFVVDGALVVNELAPRPHNSGHFTIEGCVTSQFENHLRAVLDWPLGATTLVASAVATVNVLGTSDGADLLAGVPHALAIDDVHVHLYGKTARPGRKLGHVTALAGDTATALERASRAADALQRGAVRADETRVVW